MMHNIDIDVVEMTMDIMKYVIGRITRSNPDMGLAISEEELKEKVGETITDKGIGGMKAFELFREVLVKHTVPIDNPKHLAFVPAAPTRAAILFDLVTAASSIHGSYWMEGAGGIFCENEAMSWIVSLTGLPKGSFGVFTSGGTAANLSAVVTAREYWRSKSQDNQCKRGIILCSSQAHSSVKSMVKIIDADILTVPTQESLTKKELREEVREKYGINYQGHLQELSRLRDESRKLKQMSPAVTAEKNRGQVGGLYIDRQVNINANVDLSKLSPEELQDKLDQMYEEDIKDVTPRKSEPEASEVKQDPESD